VPEAIGWLATIFGIPRLGIGIHGSACISVTECYLKGLIGQLSRVTPSIVVGVDLDSHSP
jgi:hypothetical protein